MGLWQRVKNVYSAAVYNAATLTNPYIGPGFDFSKWFIPRNIFAGRPNNTLATNETIFAAVSRLSNALGSLPLKLYKDFNPVYSDEADLLGSSPNNNMTSFDFIRTLEVLRDTTGNSYAIKIYGYNYKVESIHILDPSRVSPVFDEKSMELWYEIRGTKETYYVHNMDILHFKHVHGFGFKGISPIDVLKNTIEFDSEVRKFSLEQMDGAKASFILEYATNVSEGKKIEVIDNFRAFYKENGGILFQEPGVKISQLEQEFINSEVFEVEKITRTRVATVYNMPPHMLGETENGSYASMEQMSLQFVKDTLLPIVRQYEQEFDRKMLTKEQRKQGYKYKFNLKALLRADTATQMEAYFKGVRSAIYTPNEIRAWEELPPVPGGEKAHLSGDLYPIDTPVSERNSKAQAVVGPPGRDGLNGRDGLPGKDGLDGKSGSNGKDGRDGINGKDGLQGRDGLNGLNGKNGNDGLPGTNGIDGKGAYDLWLEAGNKGTPQDFLDSLNPQIINSDIPSPSKGGGEK